MVNILPRRSTRRVITVVVHISVLMSKMEKDNCGYNKHETFGKLMEFYKEVAPDYEQVNKSISYIKLTFSMRYLCKWVYY